jgi:hypothetical protein
MKRMMLAISLIAILALAGCTFIVGTAPAVVAFSITPNSITVGSQATLLWNVTGADTVIIQPGIGTVQQAGSQSISPSTTTTYTLTATNRTGSVTQSVVVTVNPPPVNATLSASPSSITMGDSSVITWNVTGATAVRLDPGIGTVPASGSQTVSPTATTTYTLTATNANNTVTKSFVLTVNAPPIVATFSAAPTQVIPGQAVTISWNASGATNVHIDPNLGDVQSSGSVTVYPTSDMTYIMTATNSCCAVTKTVTINVTRTYPFPSPFPFPYPQLGLPIVNIFSIAPGTIHVTQQATLHWSISNADSIFIDHGIGPVNASGSLAVTPNSTTVYTLTASNNFGSRIVSVGVVVQP